MLDPGSKFVAMALCYAADQMWGLALARCHVQPYGPNDKELYNWMTKIEPGHLVVEKSSLRLHPARIGRLLGIEKSENGDHTYTLVTMEGEVVEWRNCSFIRVPDPAGWPKDVPYWDDTKKLRR